jgi:Mlc titration factor MtfA (ptsG expression regulator)
MVMGWFKDRRRRRVLGAPFSAEWRETLGRRVRHYQYLPPAQQERVRSIVQVMLAEKEWAGVVGFTVTDEMKVTIAGIAGVMVSGYGQPYFFDRLHTIVVHPGTIRFSQEQALSNRFLPEPSPLDGVAWDRGPVLLSWEAIRDERRGQSRGRNVVLHELAHHLDGLNGEMEGVPPLDAEAEAQWNRVIEEELDRLEDDGRRGEDMLLDWNAGESRAEFFAVATECFFELPHALRRRHPELYEQLVRFYEQDPAQWLPRAD